jgi:rhodanese-related sulfurtransferase
MEPLRTTPEQVKARIDAGKIVIFVDSRREEAWDASPSKLPGAIRVSPERPLDTLNRIPKDREIVTYCT